MYADLGFTCIKSKKFFSYHLVFILYNAFEMCKKTQVKVRKAHFSCMSLKNNVTNKTPKSKIGFNVSDVILNQLNKCVFLVGSRERRDPPGHCCSLERCLGPVGSGRGQGGTFTVHKENGN